MKTIMYLVGFGSKYKECSYQTGWGCGYVMIPTTYSIVKSYEKERKEREMEDEDFWGIMYLQIGDEEITYTKYKTVNDQEYLVIGFDTAHSYNNESHDFDWVFNKTVELQQIIEKQEHE